MDSELYKVLDLMPKGALHHVHTTAAPNVDFYIKLTYNDCVYFNERERMFRVAPVSFGYYQCFRMDLMKMAT